MDLGGRTSAHVQAHSFYTNFVGNVLGFSGQTLLNYSSATYSSSQTSWQFEAINADVPDSIVSMWNIGEQQNPSGNVWVATTYQTQLRDGNWDWVTKSQSWLGLGGTQASPLGTPKTIPNSLYLASTPAFFGSNTWPWVDPATGTTFTLPAKARFASGNPNQLANNNNNNNNNLTVAVSASPSAGGTVAGGGTFAPGGSDTVTATPSGGSTFANWTENGTVVSTAASYTFTLNGNRNLVANFTVSPVNNTIAVSASPSAGGTVSGSGTFTAGTPRTVTATTNSGYTFTHWTENGTVVSSAGSYTFTLNANRNLVANFTVNPVNNTLAVGATPSTGGTVAGGGTFASGSSHTVTAIANSGYTFANWTENGTVVSSTASYTFTLNGNRNLVANFAANPMNFTVAVSGSPSTGGTVAGGGTYASGSSDTVTATPNSGYTFANWAENGTVVSSGASYTFTLNSNRNLVANFTVNPTPLSLVSYPVAVSGSPSTGGTVAGGGTYASGSSDTVTATPNKGYKFANWTENGTVVSTAASYTFTLTGNRNLVANFRQHHR